MIAHACPYVHARIANSYCKVTRTSVGIEFCGNNLCAHNKSNSIQQIVIQVRGIDFILVSLDSFPLKMQIQVVRSKLYLIQKQKYGQKRNFRQPFCKVQYGRHLDICANGNIGFQIAYIIYFSKMYSFQNLHENPTKIQKAPD